MLEQEANCSSFLFKSGAEPGWQGISQLRLTAAWAVFRLFVSSTKLASTYPTNFVSARLFARKPEYFIMHIFFLNCIHEKKT